MSFQNIDKAVIVSALKKAGVVEGDTLYVASYMPILGNAPGIIDQTVEALVETVGENGTVVIFPAGLSHRSGLKKKGYTRFCMNKPGLNKKQSRCIERYLSGNKHHHQLAYHV